MSGSSKVLFDMEFSVGTTKMQKRLADVPAEDDMNSDSETESETEGETSDSDSSSDSEYECKVCNRKFSGYLPLKQHEKGKKHAKMLLKKKMGRKLRDGNESVEGEHDDGHLVPEPYATCKVCAKDFSGPESYYLHLRSKAHKHKALEASILEQVRENGEISADKLKEFYKKGEKASEDEAKGAGSYLGMEYKAEETNEEFQCKECSKVFSGLTPFTQHLMSKSHTKRLEKKKSLLVVLKRPSDEDTASDKDKHGDLSTLTLEDDILICKLCRNSFSGPENAMMHLKSKNHAKKLDKYIRKLEKKKEKSEAEGPDKKNVQPEKEDQVDVEVTEKEHQPSSDATSKLDVPNDPSLAEAANTVTTGDKLETVKDYEKYKQYKDVMNSLPQDDVLLK